MGKGKIFQKRKKLIALWLLINLISNIAYADIIVDKNVQQNTSVDRAQNGANIININTPNNKGISVNDFKEFRTKDPTVFNNFGSGVGRSYLAGLMAANPNLTKEQAARLILNRVGGNNRAEIENWLEVMSNGKTDMIFSSQNGIYLNNIGFINFDKVIFTTSKVFLDGDGNILPFNIRSGNINIGREGIDAEGLRYLAFLSKQISVDGIVSAKDGDLDVIAGEFDYNPDTREYTNKGTNNNELLVSSSAFGSMYGSQIKVVANGGNVGVQGDLISYKVLKINADGTVTTNQSQGNEGIEVKAKEFTQNKSTYTEGNIKIEADKVTLNGTGTQGNNIDITGTLNNNSNLYAKGNVTIGNDTNSTGQLLSEKSINVYGNLDSSNTLYGKENINISGYFFNLSEVQSEGNITVGGNLTNKGKILTDSILHISGLTLNEGTLYGKNKINLQGLTNSGSIQTTGEMTAKNTTNTGKIVSEGNISILDLDNQSELITNKILTTNNLTNTGTLSTGEGITSNGNVINHGSLKTNGDFLILGNLNNSNLLNVGGLLNSKDLANNGILKVVNKISTNGINFNNYGEILTSNLDVDNTNILNTNKITVVGDAKLKGNKIDNQGNINVINLDMISPVLLNSGEISASEEIKANNTNLTNTGKLISNNRIELNNSNIVNRKTIESTNVNLGNLLSYDNSTGTIRGNNITLSTTGNLILEGKIQGIDNLLISGQNITNNGITVSSGLLRLSGQDINNVLGKTISSLRVELIGTGNILNEGMIEGETGLIKGNIITNTDLMMFLTKLDIEGTKLVNNDASIYSDEELNIKTSDVDNIGGEIVGQSKLNISGFNLLDNTKGVIDSRGNIVLSGNKLLNGGEVSGQYRLYWVTWDGQKIYEDTWRNLNDDYMQQGGKVFVKDVYDPKTGDYLYTKYDNWNLPGLDNWYLSDSETRFNYKDAYKDLMEKDQDYPLYYTGVSTSGIGIAGKTYETKVLEGKVDTSRLVTEGGRILSGGNLTLDVKELVNKNSKISAGGTLTITDKVEKIENTTDVANIKVYDGKETLKFYISEMGGNGGTYLYHSEVERSLIDEVRDYNVADGVSVIEGNNVVIQGTPTINNGYDYTLIGIGAVVDVGSITSKDVDVDLYYDPLTVHVDQSALEQIVKDGVIPFNDNVFISSGSKLFTESKDPTSKYLMETRSQYLDLSKFYGSDYFLGKIGYDESKDWNNARRLGDAYYETKYMNNLLLETLGTRFINGKADTELMKDMLDNAVVTSGDLKLTIGIALTSEQVSALKSDIIWYVEQEVNGEKVLVPQVYLSQATLENIKSPTTTIAAQDTLDISSGNLVNQGRLKGKTVYIEADNVINKSVGELRAEITGDNVSIDVKKDILNIGATIGAKENLSLEARGTISNITTAVETTEHDRLNGKERTRISDDIQNVGLISGGDTTYISGDKYVSRGAVTESGGATYIEANDISLNTIALKDFEITNERNGYDLYRTTEKIGSEVTGKDYVVMDATNDINIKGSTVASDGTVQLTAEHDINIVNDKNTMYTESKREKKGTFSSYSKLETDYQESAAASTIIGNNVIMDSGNDVKIQASNVIAVKDDFENTGGNIIITADHDINITTDDMNNEYHLKEKKSGWSASASTGNGGASAGVSYSKSKLEIDRTNVTVATSSLTSEGNTILEAGNKVRTEAMQANVGENLIISGKNGVELVDAQEVFNEKVKQETKTVGVSATVGSTITNFVNSANEKSKNSGKYGFGNKSELINSYGDGLDLYRGGVKAGADASQLIVDSMKGSNILGNLGTYGVNANVSLNVSKSKYESNTNGTTSVAGEINVGKNFILSSEGDVKLVNQKVNVGENLIVDAKNFEATAGKNTYDNKTNSSSSSASVGYDAIGNTVTGGVSGNKGNSNSSSVSYDNTEINVGNGFYLTTKEDAVFKGANVKADKIEFEIGKNLIVESLQDEYKLDGSNKGAGLSYGHNDTSNGGYNSPVGNVSYGESKGDAKWVNNQTSIIAENGGNIKVGETLTNKGSIIGSINDTMNIEAKELVTENLKDHDNGKDYNVGLGGVDSKNVVPQTDLQYSSHDKEQDTNATFVNTVVKENGKEVDLEERGINTDINKAQVITKDDVVDQIDTTLHTDLLNGEKRKDLVNDMGIIADNTVVIGTSIGTKLSNNKNGSSTPEIWELENQSLANITKAVEVAVKNKENLRVTESERDDFGKLADKFKDYGVSEIIVVSDDTVFRDSNGNIVEGAHAGFDKDTGVIYITENVAKKPLGDFNKILGEEVGELYAHKTGLGKDNGANVIVAEQIGQIFGNQMSKGKDNDSILTGSININNSLTDIKIDGADAIIQSVGFATSVGVVTGGVTGDLGFIYNPNISKTQVVAGVSLAGGATQDLGFGLTKSIVYFPNVTDKNDFGEYFYTYSISAEVGQGLGVSGGFSIIVPVKNGNLTFNNAGIALDVGAGVGFNLGATMGPGASGGGIWDVVKIPVSKKMSKLFLDLQKERNKFLKIITNDDLKSKIQKDFDKKGKK